MCTALSLQLAISAISQRAQPEIGTQRAQPEIGTQRAQPEIGTQFSPCE